MMPWGECYPQEGGGETGELFFSSEDDATIDVGKCENKRRTRVRCVSIVEQVAGE
jgi:hypothetical protein